MSGDRKGLGKVANALLNLPPMELVGPTAEDDIHRAIRRYGAEAVKAAAVKLTKRPVGNPGIDPLPDLWRFFQEDADEWLAGGDPFAARTDNAIATAYAEANGATAYEANKKRAERFIKGKRKGGRGRKHIALSIAWMDSKEGHPYGAHIRALEALRELEPEGPWEVALENVRRNVADYEAKHGPPDDSLTMKEIEEGAREQLNALLTAASPGLFGKRSRRTGGIFGLLGAHLEIPGEEPEGHK